MKTAKDTLHLGQLMNHLAEEIRGTVYPPRRRVQLALACFCIVQDHHHAIALSIENTLYASAMLLTRPLYEATVKGIWVSYCTTDESVERYASRRELPSIRQLIEELGNTNISSFFHAQLVNIKENYWKSLSFFVHSGTDQVNRWVTPSGVSPQYSEAEIKEISNFTGFFAVVASIERARLSSNLAAVERLKGLLPNDRSREA